MTYTVVTMEVPPEAWDFIAQKLKEAGYDHAFLEEDGRTLLDMTHIALARGEAALWGADEESCENHGVVGCAACAQERI